ncbi:MAG: hypothetical protein IPN46_01385 [Saprospiraceae bacterium]|nr:hypothetical protein [Saprospiraceae bacterium]
MMEELIWKYVDNICTPDERLQVEQLVQNDPKFKIIFEEIVALNAIFAKDKPKQMHDQFKSNLIAQIQNELVKTTSKPATILSTQWIIALAIPAIGAIIYALLSPAQSPILPTIDIPLSDKTIEMALWSMTGFLLLLLADYTIKKMHFFKKMSHFHLV